MFKERQVIKDILAVLYREHDYDTDMPECNPDKEWEVDSIEDIAEILRNADYTPEHCITMKPEDEIASVWCVEDVMGMLEDDDRQLSEEEARIVLQNVDRCHDASIGINWDAIDCHIDMFISDRDKKD